MLMVVAKGIEEKDNFDLVEVDRSHVGNPSVHGKNLVGAIAEGSVAAVAEIESLLKEKELSVRTEFLVALLEFRVDEMRSGEMGDGVIVCFRDASIDKTTKGAIVCLPDVVRLGVESGIWLRQRAFQPFHESKAITLYFEPEAPFLPVRFREVETEIGGPGRIGHETLGDCDVIGGGRVGM
jgi:hypothetical protein